MDAWLITFIIGFALGQYWEKMFCLLAAARGMVFSPLQIGHAGPAAAYSLNGTVWKTFTLPDIVIWTYPGQHHEIKHKAPTVGGRFGFEEYRLLALLQFADETRQDVMYTIHNHALSGGRDSQINNLCHWLTANVKTLEGSWRHRQAEGISYVNGKRCIVPILYWDINQFGQLQNYWDNQ